jgi:hypothetical protein
MENFYFLVYFIPPSSSPSSSVRLVLFLGIPMLAGDQTIQSMESQCAPSPTQSSMFPKNFSQERPFINDPMSATIVFSFTIIGSARRDGLTRDQLVMVVHRKSLLDLVPLHELVGSRSTSIICVPWKSWNPLIARWFRVDDSARGFRMHSCGQRYVQHAGNDEDDEEVEGVAPPPQSITIFYFNP